MQILDNWLLGRGSELQTLLDTDGEITIKQVSDSIAVILVDEALVARCNTCTGS